MEKKSDGLSRRKFIGNSAAAAALITVVPRHVLGGKGYIPPSDKLNIAAIGSGGMGAGNINQVASENIVALCDVDFNQAAKTFEKFPKAKQYKDFRVMLEKEKDIEAVIVATPDHTHAVSAMMAIKLGKHVYVQKPLTHSIFEARKLTEAAREYKVMSQMGNQGRSGDGVRELSEMIWDGVIGDVHEVHSWTNRPVWPQGIGRPVETPPVPKHLDWDLWLGPAPNRPYNPAYLPFNWRAWLDFGCGALGDMGCHILDPPFFALKLRYPDSVQGSHSWEVVEMWKRVDNKETYPSASHVQYTFPKRGKMPALKLNWYDGGILPIWPDLFKADTKIPTSGTIFIGKKGVIMCETYGGNVQLFGKDKGDKYKAPKQTIPRITTSHEMDWVRSCKDGKAACSNFDYSGPLTEMVLMGNLSMFVPGTKLLWDGEKMKVTNNEKANSYIQREYREGWSL
ncbi:Gfo/Idh/MocA family protein [Bacteroidota bacterium]